MGYFFYLQKFSQYLEKPVEKSNKMEKCDLN